MDDSLLKPLEEKILELFRQLSPDRQMDVFIELARISEEP